MTKVPAMLKLMRYKVNKESKMSNKTNTGKTPSGFIKESFKTIFIRKNLGEEAAKEHRQRASSKNESK